MHECFETLAWPLWSQTTGGIEMGLPKLFMLLVCLTALIIVLADLWVRFRKQQLQHEERMAALEKGVALIPAWSPRVYLLRGLIWTFAGAALTITLLGVSQTPRRAPSAEVQALQAREVKRSLDIPMDQAREIVSKDIAAHAGQNEGMPATFALFGLIPLGVGLAYLIYYRSERAIAPPAGS
jgi:hypothetical protein